MLCGSDVLPDFYTRRFFRPAWITEGASLVNASALIQAIRLADQEGLKPRDYHLEKLESLLSYIQKRNEGNFSLDLEKITDFEMLLTDAFLLYGSHLLTGLVDPEAIRAEWFIKGRFEDLAEALDKALNQSRVGEILEELKPQHSAYVEMKSALMHLRRLKQKGGWPIITPGPKMQAGDQGPRIRALRSHLVTTGDLLGSRDSDPEVFDEKLEKAVQRFQRRHGFRPDGIVGEKTVEELNVPEESRLHQLRINLERWRWLPHDLGKRHILVNAEATEIDPADIDWNRVTDENFRLKLRQEPGPLNSLGRIKFMFPNKFGIYLHDTPARGLFNEVKRTFSSGCIRIKKPIELAVYLLEDHPEWTRGRILQAINSKKNQTIQIPDPITVHLLYWTAWVDKDGILNFREDIYGRDLILGRALNERPPKQDYQ